MQFRARVVANRSLGPGGFVLRLDDCAALRDAQPGQFVMVRGDWDRDPLLPRAFSILRTDGDRCELLIKAVGRGTHRLAAVSAGDVLQIVGPLGRAFSEPHADDVLVAGGVGLAPLLWLLERARDRPHMIYGARSAADLVLLDEIRRTGAHVTITTEDGSTPVGRRAERGRVTDALDRLSFAPNARIMTCGPNAMMRAVVAIAERKNVSCIVSVEGEMACGIGACLGCAVATKNQERSFHYACVDGPVFDAKEIVLP